MVFSFPLFFVVDGDGVCGVWGYEGLWEPVWGPFGGGREAEEVGGKRLE